jgi:hypothetical protein
MLAFARFLHLVCMEALTQERAWSISAKKKTHNHWLGYRYPRKENQKK